MLGLVSYDISEARSVQVLLLTLFACLAHAKGYHKNLFLGETPACQCLKLCFYDKIHIFDSSICGVTGLGHQSRTFLTQNVKNENAGLNQQHCYNCVYIFHLEQFDISSYSCRLMQPLLKPPSAEWTSTNYFCPANPEQKCEYLV